MHSGRHGRRRVCGISLVCWAFAAASLLAGDLAEWRYREGDETKVIEAAACRSTFDDDRGCNMLVFELANGKEIRLPMSAFSEPEYQRFAAATEAAAKKRKEKERLERTERDRADRTRAMRLSVRLREEAFGRLPRRQAKPGDDALQFVRRALTTDRFAPAVYLNAVGSFQERLVPATSSGDAVAMRQALRRFTTAELAALDDFVLSTELGKSTVAGSNKTWGDILISCWRAALEGPAEDHRPVFIEPAMRDLVVPLPGGKSFVAAGFFPAQGVRLLFEEGEKKKDNYATLMPVLKNDVPFAVLTQRSGKLNGPSYAQFEDGGLMMAGTYADNKRTGRFLVLSEDRAIRFAAEYNAKGDKEGILCVFRAGSPLLLQECRNGRAETTHICDEDARVVFSFKGIPTSPPEGAGDALAFLERVEEELREGEDQVQDYVEKVEHAVRHWRAARNGAMARARVGELQRQQEIGGRQLIQSMRRWTGH